MLIMIICKYCNKNNRTISAIFTHCSERRCWDYKWWWRTRRKYGQVLSYYWKLAWLLTEDHIKKYQPQHFYLIMLGISYFILCIIITYTYFISSILFIVGFGNCVFFYLEGLYVFESMLENNWDFYYLCFLGFTLWGYFFGGDG